MSYDITNGFVWNYADPDAGNLVLNNDRIHYAIALPGNWTTSDPTTAWFPATADFSSTGNSYIFTSQVTLSAPVTTQDFIVDGSVCWQIIFRSGISAYAPSFIQNADLTCNSVSFLFMQYTATGVTLDCSGGPVTFGAGSNT